MVKFTLKNICFSLFLIASVGALEPDLDVKNGDGIKWAITPHHTEIAKVNFYTKSEIEEMGDIKEGDEIFDNPTVLNVVLAVECKKNSIIQAQQVMADARKQHPHAEFKNSEKLQLLLDKLTQNEARNKLIKEEKTVKLGGNEETGEHKSSTWVDTVRDIKTHIVGGALAVPGVIVGGIAGFGGGVVYAPVAFLLPIAFAAGNHEKADKKVMKVSTLFALGSPIVGTVMGAGAGIVGAFELAKASDRFFWGPREGNQNEIDSQ
jgi:hypothetical protein